MLISSALVVLALLVFGKYVKKETVQGYIVPELGIVQIAASRPGKITRVLVREGQRVSKNDPVVELSGDSSGTETGRVLRAQLNEMRQQVQLLTSRRTQIQLNFDSQLADLKSKFNAQTLLVQVLESRRDHQRQLVDISRDGLARIEQHADAIPAVQVEERRQQLLLQEQELSGVDENILRAKISRDEIGNQLAALPAKRSEAYLGIDQEISGVRQREIELSAIEGFVERAPVAGVVASLQADVGQTTNGNLPLISIIPDGSALQAELLLPTRAAGFVKVGNSVRLLVEAYPFERFGFLNGRVLSISRSVLKPGEFLAPLDFREAVYRVRVGMDREYVLAFGEKRPLQSGMALSADIVIDRRPLWHELVDPLLATTLRAR